MLKVKVYFKQTLFSEELVFEDVKERTFSTSRYTSNFEISIDKQPIFKGSRMIAFYFKDKRVEADSRDGCWSLRIGRFEEIQLSATKRRRNAAYVTVIKSGRIIGRILHSNSRFLCSRKYIVNYDSEENFEIVLFAFNFYLNEKTRNYTI